MDTPAPVCPKTEIEEGRIEGARSVPSDWDHWRKQSRSQQSLPAGVVFQSSAYAPTGSAAEAREVALGLERRGLPMCLAASDSPDETDAHLAPLVQAALEQLTHAKLDLARSVLYYASEPTRWNLDYYGQARVGRVSHWSDRIPCSWVEPCNALDEIWVPSEFQHQICAACGVEERKIRVLRTGLDTRLFRPGWPPLPIPRRGVNFLTVTDFQDRQGTEMLLTAFLQEFRPSDDVSLTLKTLPRNHVCVDLAAELAWFVEKTAGIPLEQSPELILLDQLLPQEELPALYAAADAFVLPSRGESSACSLREALSCELPVIATSWGPALEFLDRENSFLVESEGLAGVSTADEFLPAHRWASPSLEHLRQQMRAVYTHPEAARACARRGRQKLVCECDWSVVLPLWEEAFHRLLG